MKKDLSKMIKEVSLRVGFLQNSEQENYDEREVVLEVLEVLAKYGISIQQLKIMLEKQVAPKEAVIKASLAAEILGVSVSWLQAAIRAGEFKEWAIAAKATSSSRHYIILKHKFEEFAGVDVNEYLKVQAQKAVQANA